MFTVAAKGCTFTENVPFTCCPTPSVSVRVKVADAAVPLAIMLFTRPLKSTYPRLLALPAIQSRPAFTRLCLSAPETDTKSASGRVTEADSVCRTTLAIWVLAPALRVRMASLTVLTKPVLQW